MRKRVPPPLVFAAFSAGLALLILVLLSVSVRIQDLAFRHRAERLFGDIESIDVTHATFREVASIFVRWDRFGGFVEPCSEQHCDFGAAIAGPIVWRDDSKLVPILPRFYRLLGGHPAIARANVDVRNGLVQAKHYSLAIEAPPVLDADGRTLTYYLQGSISTERGADAKHPAQPPANGRLEYQIGSNACLGCLEIHVIFTLSADVADVRRLSYINFSCLTRQHPCRTKDDIMPFASSESSQEIQPSHSPL
jgi:hypothetical protein